MSFKLFAFSCFVPCWLFFSSLDAAEVRYTLDFSQAATHHVLVKAEFDAAGKEFVEIYMPVWTPGSYLVREYARHIETISASDQNGKVLPIRKTRKNRWKINTGKKVAKVQVHYRLYCRELSVRTNWVEEEFAILNGAPTFLSAVDSRNSKHLVQVVNADRWSTISTALTRDQKQASLFHAANFDDLVDSPILLGNQVVKTFDVAGKEHELVCLGGDGLWDHAKAAGDLAKIVEAHHEVWGTVPYENYKFLNLIVETGGGLEHDNSTLMMTSRWSFGTRSRYLSWLSLASHEFFHTWNIRRLRPVELVEYDYEKENYFSTLWIGEGITSYYDDLLVKRAGLSSEREYLSQLSKQISSLQSTEGRLTQSLSDSSHDTWIKFYRPDENSKNARISYYTKGAVAGFLLDAEIRSATGGKKSLDDVMRELYRKHAGKVGFTSEQFRQLASETAGKDLSDWFSVSIDSTEELNYETALKHFGLKFPKPSLPKQSEPVWTGLNLSTSNGIVTVSTVTRGSPAFKAGINVGDEIIALAGYRVTSSDLSSKTKSLKPGDVRKCLLTRRGQVFEKEIKFEARPSRKWTLSKVSKPSKEQVSNLNRWLINKKPDNGSKGKSPSPKKG